MVICCITFTDAWHHVFGAVEITKHLIWQAFLTKLYKRLSNATNIDACSS